MKGYNSPMPGQSGTTPARGGKPVGHKHNPTMSGSTPGRGNSTKFGSNTNKASEFGGTTNMDKGRGLNMPTAPIAGKMGTGSSLNVFKETTSGSKPLYTESKMGVFGGDKPSKAMPRM